MDIYKKIAITVAVALVIAIIVLLSNQFIIAKQKEDRQATKITGHYYNGEILYPDYIHDDTLVVFNAQNLNIKMDSIENTIADDADIEDILYKYSIPTNLEIVKYLPNEDSTGYIISARISP